MRHPTRAILWFLPLSLAVAACGGGGGGGGSTPPVTPNDAPQLVAPTELSGGPVSFRYVLPIAGSQTLTFRATDPDGDSLQWQVAVSASGASNAGLSFASPAAGSIFTIDLAAVTVASAANLSVLVEDNRGAASAIDILLIRSGAPTVTSVSRSSAFATAPQDVTIHGSAFSLGNTVSTLASFSGVVADNVTVANESTLTCTTPQAAQLGANSVGVSNPYGSATAPAGSFTMYSYPVDLLDADTALDSGGGSQLVTANVGARMHAVWIEGAAVMHARSLDGGATFGAAVPLSGAEVPSSVRIQVAGDNVLVLWIGDASGFGGSLHVRSSVDGGAVFAADQVLATSGAQMPDLAISGVYAHCVWVQAGPSLDQKVYVASSTNNAVSWGTAKPAYASTVNQTSPAVGCFGGDAWIALRQGAEQRVYTTHTTNAGFFWSSGVARSTVAAIPDSAAPKLCNDGSRVYLVWSDSGALYYMISENAGLGWPTVPSLLRAADLGSISTAQAAVDCEADRLAVAYVAGGSNVAFTRIGASGALPEHVTLSTAVAAARQPNVALRGNYVFAVWSGGDVGAGSARIQLATSIDRGLTFLSPVTFGDGTAAQDAPRLLADDARLWLGWLDYRSGASLFSSRTEQ